MSDRRITHGKCPRGTQPKKYTAWCNLKRRCNDPTHPAFKDYGGRGITFHPPWNDFAQFDADVPDPPAPNLTLDRIRNNEGYVPGNVQWADRTAQARNRRNTVMLTLNGVTKPMVQWAEEKGLNQITVRKRLYVYGWTVDRALSIPARSWGR